MFSESDENEQYTVHEVDSTGQKASSLSEVLPRQAEEMEGLKAGTDATASSSPLARYYRLGTQERHAFDERMRRLREEAHKSMRDRAFREQHPFRPLRETVTLVPHTTTSEREVKNEKEQRCGALAEQGTETVSTATSPAKPVFDRLAAQAVQLELRRRHREEQKRRSEAAALRDAFQPEINRNAPVYSDQLRHLDDVPVEERLLHYGETAARERQRRQEMKALEEKAALQNAQASAIWGHGSYLQHMGPEERRRFREEFEKRNKEFLAQKEQHRLRAEEETAGKFSFRPQISATSAALDEVRQRDVLQTQKTELQGLLDRSTDGASFTVKCDASQRSDALYALAVARQRQHTEPSRSDKVVSSGRGRKSCLGNSGKKKHNISPSEKEEEDVSHQPQTNPTSTKWIASGPHRHFFEHGFVRRQALYEQVKEEVTNMKAASSQTSASPPNAAGCTAGNDRDGTPAATITSSRKLNTKELNERLYYSARKAGEVAQRRRAALLNARECPFRPELSPGTLYVLQRRKESRDGDVVKRLTGTALLKSLEQKKPEIDPTKKGLYEAAPNTHRSRSVTTPSPLSSASPPLSKEKCASAEVAETPAQTRAVITRDQVEHFYRRQMDFLQERQDLIQERKEGEAVQELIECTFRPRTNTDWWSNTSSVPAAASSATTPKEETPSLSHVTGVSSFLERQKMARQRKAEHEELVRTMGLPRNKSTTGVNVGTKKTLLSPFTLQTAQRQRRRSSYSSPSQHTRSPAQAGEYGEVSPKWVNGLTASERVLYDALVEADQWPTTSTAPLFPLPGYARSEEGKDTNYFDDLKDYESAAIGNRGFDDVANENALDLSPPCIHPISRDLPTEGYREKTSLFSSLSPNTFSGRSLASVSQNLHVLQGHKVALSQHPSVKPSALKGATAAKLTPSAHRRKQTRTVSFAVDGSASLPRSGRTSFTGGGSHVDPLRRLAH